MRVRGLAAAGGATPGQVLARATPGDFAFLPRNAKHLGSDAVAIAHRRCAQVPDAGLDIELPVRLQNGEAVKANRASDEATGSDADAAHFSAALLELSFALLPFELLHAAIERFLDEATRDVGPLAVGTG